MARLHLTALSDDGTHLVLAAGDGTTHELPVDAALRAAVAAAPDRPAPPTDPTLPPREIQRRVRAGEDLEAIAAAAGVTVERVRSYAIPVLAEREHVVAQALACTVEDVPLADLVARTAASAGTAPEAIGYDARVGEDARWRLTATLPDGRTGSWHVDIGARLVDPEDAVAAWLVGGPAPDGVVPDEQPPAPPTKPRRASIPSWDEILLRNTQPE